MGNTGRPSTGCSRCRKRRIKCDERRPSCVRCEKLGEECPGYKHGFWIFRDENDTAKRRALKQARQTDDVNSNRDYRSANSDASSPSQEIVQYRKGQVDDAEAIFAHDLDSSDITEIVQPSMNVGLSTDLELRSVCLFMENFTLDASTEGNDPAFLDFLPEMYVSVDADPSLRRAVKAVALYNFANRYRASDLASSAQIAYGNALATTNKSLRDPATATSDSVLAAVFLLGLYELVCRPDVPSIGGLAWTNHIFGTLQLLRLRWKQQLKTATERHLFQTVHLSVLIAHIMAYMPPPPDSMGFILAQEYPEGLGAKIALVFFCKVVEVRAKIHQAVMTTVRGSTPESESLSALLDEADAVLQSQSFANWVANEPHWQVAEHIPTSNTRTGKYTFGSRAVAHMWIHHWTAQMCLRKSMLDGYLALEAADGQFEEKSDADTKIASLRTGIETLADQILGSVDYSLRGSPSKSPGEPLPSDAGHSFEVGSSVGALQLFWPLGTIKHVPFTTPMQKSIASNVLRKIGTELSIAQALLHVH